MITMNKLAFVPMAMSMLLISCNYLLFIFSFILVAYFYIEMPVTRKNVIIYVILKLVYVHMNRMRKAFVLRMVRIARMLTVRMIFDNRFLTVENYKIAI